MIVNENRIREYLAKHVGDLTRTIDIVKDSNACEGMDKDQISDKLMEIDHEIRMIAQDNGYRFNSHHHAYEERGLPWTYDFYIEIADVDKDIARINQAFQLKMKVVLIQEEYGIYDEEKDLMIGFRTTIPWQIKKIYDEICDEIEELEADGRIID